jgi:hypothetical protein
MSVSQHPDAILQKFLAEKPRPQKVKNLHAIHDLCRAQHQVGSKDFSIPTIGKLCEERGILKARGLYNAPLADYRALIDAWAVYAGPATPKPIKVPATDEYIVRIEDPAIRILVQQVIAERNKLKSQLNTLKAATTVVVDRRPAERGNVDSPRAPSLGLTESERKALEKATSLAFLEAQAWREVELGEIVNARGRTIFDPGFATGLRKLLQA